MFSKHPHQLVRGRPSLSQHGQRDDAVARLDRLITTGYAAEGPGESEMTVRHLRGSLIEERLREQYTNEILQLQAKHVASIKTNRHFTFIPESDEDDPEEKDPVEEWFSNEEWFSDHRRRKSMCSWKARKRQCVKN